MFFLIDVNYTEEACRKNPFLSSNYANYIFLQLLAKKISRLRDARFQSAFSAGKDTSSRDSCFLGKEKAKKLPVDSRYNGIGSAGAMLSRQA